MKCKKHLKGLISLLRGWTLPESGYSWQGIEVSSGSDCQISNAAYVDNYSINQNDVEAALMSPKINLEVFDNPTLGFDYAYVRYGNNYSDGLKVEISSDCGASWATLWRPMILIWQLLLTRKLVGTRMW